MWSVLETVTEPLPIRSHTQQQTGHESYCQQSEAHTPQTAMNWQITEQFIKYNSISNTTLLYNNA